LNQQDFFGFTQAHIISTGFREATTWGKAKDPQVTAGADLRYLSQYLNEFDFATAFQPNNYGIPTSHQVDPGLFVDGVLPLGENLVVKSGARVDLVSFNIDHFGPPFGVSEDPAIYRAFVARTYNTPTTSFGRDMSLWSVYLTDEYKLTPHITAL